MDTIISAAALDHFNTVLPGNGKPSQSSDRKEWTVYAAILATKTGTTWVVSSATGTKCTAVSDEGWEASSILHDSHAEVLTRRGLIRVLWSEIHALQNNSKISDDYRSLLEQQEGDSSTFRLKSEIDLHLYVSDSPCGDASIYDIEVGKTCDNHVSNSSTQFTGAKVVVSAGTGVRLDQVQGYRIDETHVAREGKQQLLGKLRTKSGRSNLEVERRSTSMSCSDKLVRWNILGLQGGSLTHFLPEPIRLKSCVVGKDPRNKNPLPQLAALDRCFCRRIKQAADVLKQSSNPVVVQFATAIALPTAHIADTTFPYGKAAMEKNRCNTTDDKKETTKKRKRGQDGGRFPATGFSINWTQYDNTVEVTVGARGMRQGKKPKTREDYQRLESRLCRNRIRKLPSQPASEESHCHPYKEWKDQLITPTIRAVREELFQRGPLAGWLIGEH